MDKDKINYLALSLVIFLVENVPTLLITSSNVQIV